MARRLLTAEDPVQGVGQVLERIDERAVQVADHAVVLQRAHLRAQPGLRTAA